MTQLLLRKYKIPAAELGEENPLPIFRDPVQDTEIKFGNSLPEEDRIYMGWQKSFRVLPYRMQDKYNRKLRNKEFISIVLENDFLKATFLPQFGGRLVSLFYKPDERELLFCNPVFQPANLALRNAWFAGGIEWNLDHPGHPFHSCSPIYAARIVGINNEPALRLYEWERLKKVIWQIDFHLPSNSSFLFARIKIINTDIYEIPMFWWTNIAVTETNKTRIISPADSVILLDDKTRGFCYSEIQKSKYYHQKDITYPTNSTYSNEIFFRIPEDKFKWIAALDEKGCGILECSTSRLRGRKLFCWGMHQGGRNWQEFLSIAGKGYFEIQAGLTRTQEQSLPMPGRTEWAWTEAFGYIRLNPKRVHSSSWKTACNTVERAIFENISEEELKIYDHKLSFFSKSKPIEILSEGSGWGALELKRIEVENEKFKFPESFLFPEKSIGIEQKKWLNLLEKGYLTSQNPNIKPGEWMIQNEWQVRLERSVKKKDRNNWYAWLHLGVMCMENGHPEWAKKAWESSIALQPSCWAYRNLAEIEIRRKNIYGAISLMDKAWDIALDRRSMELSLAIEYLQLLNLSKNYKKALDIYKTLPNSYKKHERILIVLARIALMEGDIVTTEKILENEFAGIREGETELTDIWFKMWEKKLAMKQGYEVKDKISMRIKREYNPPARIDFRL